MLKISQSLSDDRTATLQLDGKLIGPWVDQLRGLCNESLSSGKEVVLDFANLSFLDTDGISFILALTDNQVSIRNCSSFVAEQLSGIAQSRSQISQIMDSGATKPEPRSGSKKASGSKTGARPGERRVATLSSSTDEHDLIAALRRGEELAFEQVVNTYHNCLLRAARMYVSSEGVAEEVVQETWLGVLRGLDKFEGRCSLKTWIFQILINRARTRGEREARMIPFSAMFDPQSDTGEPAVDPGQFNDNNPESPGGWVSQPRDWGRSPEQSLLLQEFRALVQSTIDALPLSQKEVITLRDVQGWTSDEVCNSLGVSETNQRVLLHRARSKVRQALDPYFATK